MPINRPKPLFKVASEFNVSTQSIVDTLEDKGLNASNRPNFKITPDMYVVLEQVYGEDKAKSADHERAKEAYESRRNHMMNQRNDSVTVDQFLEPLEDEKPEDKTPAASIEDDLLGGLEPVDEGSVPNQAEVIEETSGEVQIAEDKVEVDLEPHTEEDKPTESDTEFLEEKLTSSLASTKSDDEVTSDELNYWMKNVDPMIASSSGREYFERVDAASHDQSKPGEKVVGLNIHYTMSPDSDRNHFWKFRSNLASAIKESGEDLSVNVWRSRGGGEQGHIQVSFGFRSMEEYGNFYKVMSKVGDTYMDMFGEDSWDTDLDLLRGTIQMWGARTELIRFLPELSSPPIALQ